MENIVPVISVIMALGIFNVWVLRVNRPTGWRGGNARSMREEFAVYGLPHWAMTVVGFLKLSLASLLVVTVWLPEIRPIVAGGMAALMLGAVVMHFKVRDATSKAVPSLTMLVMSLTVALA